MLGDLHARRPGRAGWPCRATNVAKVKPGLRLAAVGRRCRRVAARLRGAGTAAAGGLSTGAGRCSAGVSRRERRRAPSPRRRRPRRRTRPLTGLAGGLAWPALSIRRAEALLHPLQDEPVGGGQLEALPAWLSQASGRIQVSNCCGVSSRSKAARQAAQAGGGVAMLQGIWRSCERSRAIGKIRAPSSSRAVGTASRAPVSGLRIVAAPRRVIHSDRGSTASAAARSLADAPRRASDRSQRRASGAIPRGSLTECADNAL